MALTRAFFHGIQAAGAAARDTDFIFWNADFLAADGTFRTLSDLIAAGVRCTLAPSLRVDQRVVRALDRHLAHDPAVLDIGPREWVGLALRYLHPTVAAKIVNRFVDWTMSHPNQFYWRIDDTLMVGRCFILFMLHLRPEVVWDEVYGFCDYTFVPEMVPSRDYHYETQSDRLLIVEIQHDEKEWERLVSAERQITAADAVPSLAFWTTREHVLSSRELAVFNSGEIAADLPMVRRVTDAFMDKVYELLPPERQWHNGHVYWRECCDRAGLAYMPPGPDHPRSHLAAALRWTGYDLDVLREGWPSPPEPLRDILQNPYPLVPSADRTEAWLSRVQALCLAAWLDDDGVEDRGETGIDLTAPGFRGIGWGLLRRLADGWARCLGPDGQATILVRVSHPGGVRIVLRGTRHPDAIPESLSISVNETAVPAAVVTDLPGQSFVVAADAIAEPGGHLAIRLQQAPPDPTDGNGPSFAFATVTIERQ